MSLVKQGIIIEIRERMTKAVELKQTIDNSKTETKRNVYKKKLKKNNIEAADLFIALSKLTKKEAANGVNDEVSVLERRTEKTDGNKSSVE